MSIPSYDLPKNLEGKCDIKTYRRWLQRKAQAHVRRDRRRFEEEASISDYKKAIHMAVIECCGLDSYSGEELRWDLISKYDNAKSKEGKKNYKKKFEMIPSVDHVNDGNTKIKFKICSWKLNSAKNDLSYNEFLNLCKTVIKHSNMIKR